MNDSLPPDGPGAEQMPLVPLRQSPDQDRRQRAKQMSKLSLQSIASDVYDVADAEDDDELVGIWQHCLIKNKTLPLWV